MANWKDFCSFIFEVYPSCKEDLMIKISQRVKVITKFAVSLKNYKLLMVFCGFKKLINNRNTSPVNHVQSYDKHYHSK